MIGLALAMAASSAACDLPPGWAAITARRTRYVIFGETHGTEEAPAFVGRVACALAARRERLLLAIEQGSTDDAAFQAIWAGPDRGFADALRAASWWKGRTDGVASEAMLALLVRLHRLRVGGKSVDVVLFNGAKDDAQRARFANLPAQGPHEAAQAENIRVATGARRYDHVLVLTGSLHARKDPVARQTATFLPMAMQLAPATATTALRFYAGAGTMWNCIRKPDVVLKPGQPITSDMIDCGKHAVRGVTTLSGAPFVALGTPAGVMPEGTYDGYVWLGSITGSAPAVLADQQ